MEREAFLQQKATSAKTLASSMRWKGEETMAELLTSRPAREQRRVE
jgi:hypothetical protein